MITMTAAETAALCTAEAVQREFGSQDRQSYILHEDGLNMKNICYSNLVTQPHHFVNTARTEFGSDVCFFSRGFFSAFVMFA